LVSIEKSSPLRSIGYWTTFSKNMIIGTAGSLRIGSVKGAFYFDCDAGKRGGCAGLFPARRSMVEGASSFKA
ncbi:MAG: hypothetical protein WBB38_07440, partial [Hyphomicrobiaceae bacterium]